jgi:hypothetical protein
MPPHPDFSQEQATQIASYILKQGGDKYHWIYPGLEGAFRTMEKPKDNAEGLYVLTASYTSRSGKRGEHSIVFKIK